MTAELDDIFARLQRQVERAEAGDFGVPNDLAETAPEVVGSDDDELIQITMKAGKATGVRLHPKALRLDNQSLGELITVVINRTIDANLEAVMAVVNDNPDYATMQSELKEVQQESMNQLNKYTDGMLEMLRKSKEL